MIDLQLTQGTPEWHAARNAHFCASEAPAMMGVSKYTTRSQLMREKVTGVKPEHDAGAQARFDAGHAAEARARAILEHDLGEEFYPIVATDDDDYLLASVDGINLAEDTVFEHKLLNADVVQQIRLGELSPAYYWQLEQILHVTGAERVIFVCSDGTRDNFHRLEYRAVPGRAEQLLAGWAQFAQDMASWQDEPESAPVAVGRTPDNLPALRVEVTGEVTHSNLDAYREHALAVFASINRELTTDQHFADAEKTVRWCSDVESRLEAVKQNALAQTKSIDELFRTIDGISAEARRVRLELDKLVKARKESIRTEIVASGNRDFRAHISALNERLGRELMPAVPVDFMTAIRNKRTVASLRDAVDAELTRAKLAANAIADRIQVNLRHFEQAAAGYEGLFVDLRQIVTKEAEDFAALVQVRVAEAKAAEERRARQQPVVESQTQQATPVASQVAPVVSDKPVARVVPLRAGTAPKAASRPTDDELIDVLALHYRVHESKVIEWLLEVDLKAASKRMAREFS